MLASWAMLALVPVHNGSVAVCGVVQFGSKLSHGTIKALHHGLYLDLLSLR